MRLSEFIVLLVIGLFSSFGTAVTVFAFSTLLRMIAVSMPATANVRYVIKPAVTVMIAASIAVQCVKFDAIHMLADRQFRIRG